LQNARRMGDEAPASFINRGGNGAQRLASRSHAACCLTDGTKAKEPNRRGWNGSAAQNARFALWEIPARCFGQSAEVGSFPRALRYPQSTKPGPRVRPFQADHDWWPRGESNTRHAV